MDRLDQRKAELDKKLDNSDLGDAVASLFKEARRAKRRQLILAISIALDLILTAGFFVVYKQANTNHQIIVNDCYSRNESRANNKQLWDYLFALPPEKPPTATEQAQIDKFRDFVNETFAPKDCTKI